MPEHRVDRVSLLATFIQQAEIEDLKRRVREISGKNASLQTENASLQNDITALRKKVAEMDNQTSFSFARDKVTGNVIMEGHNGPVPVDDYRFKVGQVW